MRKFYDIDLATLSFLLSHVIANIVVIVVLVV